MHSAGLRDRPTCLRSGCRALPLIVLVTVSAVRLLFGGVYVLLSVPLAAVLATLADVLAFDRDPAKQEVPRILFSAADAET